MMDFEKVSRRLNVCPKCQAQPGEHCRTNTGRTSTTNHASRTVLTYEVWGEAYDEGLIDMYQYSNGSPGDPEFPGRVYEAAKKRMKTRAERA